ncbi:MAG: DUF3048 domain-containing protein [Ruminococcaceae bacterium]|nr:DUF3048 domain-containing protein [Oscillospiraceae bacterium]
MKRFTSVVALLLAVTIVPGCSLKNKQSDHQPVATPVVTPVATPEPTEAPVDPFLETYINTDERPIAVMIDNDDQNARPQAGLDEAYLIYEMLVEGGATRFMALFRNTDVEKIGPVRSSRHYFLDYVMENDAIYTHFGWSPQAGSDITTYQIQKINGVLGEDADTFWREEKFKGDWHSVYTSIEKITEKADVKSYPNTTERTNGIAYAEAVYTPQSTQIANEVSFDYSTRYQTSYTFNPETKLYEKYIFGEPHKMQNGNVLSVQNIIVQLVTDTSWNNDPNRRELQNTGSGVGYYITNGVYEEITWEKPSREENTVYKKADGTPLQINPGKTIINLISPALGVQFE